MASEVWHFPNQPIFGPPLSREISIVNSVVNSISACATGANKMDLPIDDLQESPRPPKLKVIPQRPGPNGSRVIRNRSSIPRLGAGLGTLVTQITRPLEPVKISVTNPESASNVDSCLSTTGVSDAQSSIDKEIEDTYLPYGSPVSSAEEDMSFASSNSFDGIHLSSPNSTPPPSNELVRNKNELSLTTSTVNNHPFQPSSGYPSGYPSPHQYIPHLADKLTSVVPRQFLNTNHGHDSLPAHLAGPETYDGSSPTAPISCPPFLGPTSARVAQFPGPHRPYGDHDRTNEVYSQRSDRLGVMPKISPTKQPNRGNAAVAPNSHTLDPASNTYYIDESYGTQSSPFPREFTNLPLTQPILPFKVLSKADKLRSLEFKLKEYILTDAKVAETSFTGVHVFVDMSNIGIGFLNAVKILQGVPLNHYLKTPISFENLARILERGRNVQKRVLAGSLAFPASRRENWPSHLREAENLNYEMNIFDRVQVERKTYKFNRKNRSPPQRSTLSSPADITSADESTEDGANPKIIKKNGEQGVDENLHLNMMHSILDHQDPGTMVLATGDAAQAQFSDGFKQHATRALRKGWKVEVISWSRNMSSAWYDPKFRAEYAGQIRIIELDEFIEELHAGSIV